ncbi:NAD-dependent epimerase/dehydratase family protein [archaeon]|nr:MAG: NAD-dependent epimerase/dehydratase family protein [archaeon]
MASPAPLVLVTGITGFIGSWVAAALLQLGYRYDVRLIPRAHAASHAPFFGGRITC